MMVPTLLIHHSTRYAGGTVRKLLWDISGAFGDIGVFFPLAILLVAQNGIYPTSLFLAAGSFYIASAFYFRITMPVQPLKAMCVIAIASGLGFEILNAAGITMGVILLVIALTGGSAKLGKLFPVSVIRGIQLGLGAMLARTSFDLIFPDIIIACIVGVLLLATITMFKHVPPLIPVLIVGIVLSFKSSMLSLTGPAPLTLSLPSYDDLLMGFFVLVLPQIALTFGNAIVATRDTGIMLYGKRAHRLNLTSIPVSIGLANIVSGLMGGAPMCHGSGGMTAHHTFGARDNISGYIIGGTLIALALLFGNSAVSFITAFPSGILGVLLLYVGIQHALYLKDIIDEQKALVIALIVGITGFVLNNLTIGFLAGLTLYHGYAVIKKITASTQSTM